MDKYQGKWTDIFVSKRFWSMFVGLFVMILVAVVPELEDQADALTNAIVTLVLAVIAGYTVQDTAANLKGKDLSESEK